MSLFVFPSYRNIVEILTSKFDHGSDDELPLLGIEIDWASCAHVWCNGPWTFPNLSIDERSQSLHCIALHLMLSFNVYAQLVRNATNRIIIIISLLIIAQKTMAQCSGASMYVFHFRLLAQFPVAHSSMAGQRIYLRGAWGHPHLLTAVVRATSSMKAPLGHGRLASCLPLLPSSSQWSSNQFLPRFECSCQLHAARRSDLVLVCGLSPSPLWSGFVAASFSVV